MDYMTKYLEELSPNQSLNSTAGLSDPLSSLSLRHLPAIQLPSFPVNLKNEKARDRFVNNLTLLII